MRNVTFGIIFIVALLVGACGVQAQDLSVVQAASNAYAYDPENPNFVVVLLPGDTIPDGWEVYLADDSSSLTLLLPGGQTVTFSNPGYFTLTGEISGVSDSVQSLVAGQASDLDSTKSNADDLSSEMTDGESARESGLDVAIPDEDLSGAASPVV